MRRRARVCRECGGLHLGKGDPCGTCQDERVRLAELHRPACAMPVDGQEERIQKYRVRIARGQRLFE